LYKSEQIQEVPNNAKVCPLCRGVEWIFTDTDGISAADRCQCFKEKLSANRVAKANIPTKYAGATFDSFLVHEDVDPAMAEFMRGIIMSVKTFVRNFKSDRGLLLYGPNGTGKTHLAVTAFRELVGPSGKDGRFINYQALLRMIKAGYDKPFGRIERTAEYDALENSDILLLDDLGSNRVTDWVEDTITDLIAQRYDNQRPLIVTTNYSPINGPTSKTVTLGYLGDRIGERATSRLRQMCTALPMPNSGDYRSRNHNR
jgi:DNA replication protein DnaC